MITPFGAVFELFIAQKMREDSTLEDERKLFCKFCKLLQGGIAEMKILGFCALDFATQIDFQAFLRLWKKT